MNRDDRLFATIGGTVVTAAATVFLVFAGSITGPVEDRPIIRVTPIPVAEKPEPEPDVVKASFDEPDPVLGDALVRSLAGGISAHPEWASWLVTDDLVQRFVEVVEAVADGYSPRGDLGFAATAGPFLVRQDEGRLVIAAGTFRRYNLAVDVFDSLDAEAVVTIVEELGPAIREARRDAAWHRGEFDDRLRLAVDHLLEVEIPAGAIEVERRTTTYAFAEDDQERLSDAQRQLLRMGRENATTVQAKLREIRKAFDWPSTAAPAAEGVQIAVADEIEPRAAEPIVIAEATTHEPGAEEIAMVPIVEPVMTALDAPVRTLAAPIFQMEEASVAPTE